MEAVNRFSSYQDKDSLRVVLLDSSLTVCQSITAELRKDNHLVTCCTTLEESNQKINSLKPDLLIIGYLGEVSSLELFREYSNQSEELPIILLTHTPEVNQFFRDWVISHGGYDVVSWFSEKSDLLRGSLQRLIRPALIPQPIAESPVEVKEVIVPTPSPSQIAAPPSQNIQPPSVKLEVKAVADPVPQPSEIASQSEESESLQLPSERSFDVEELVAPAPKAIATPSSQSSQSLTYKQALAALNQISESSLVYFGGLVIGNYWKKAHASFVQAHPWLQSWLVNHNGVISYSGESDPEESITDEQFQSLKLWVAAFIKECDRIIGDYAELLQQSQPSAELVKMIS